MDYRNEVYRKIVHIAFALFPLSYLFFLDRDVMLWVLGILTGTIVVGEVLRMRFEFFSRLYRLIFGRMVREDESHSFTGATYTLTGSFLTVLIFEKHPAVFALLLLALADSTAALVGKRWGRTPLVEKTVEGTATFLAIAILLAVIVPGIPKFPAILAALVASVVELVPSPVDDNVMIPLSAGLTIALVSLIT
ncbi:MAG: hypothetical protein V3U24_00580 [Candidatus Neomarinimicrobiota bacterium]